jgi:hypothetical protein
MGVIIRQKRGHFGRHGQVLSGIKRHRWERVLDPVRKSPVFQVRRLVPPVVKLDELLVRGAIRRVVHDVFRGSPAAFLGDATTYELCVAAGDDPDGDAPDGNASTSWGLQSTTSDHW